MCWYFPSVLFQRSELFFFVRLFLHYTPLWRFYVALFVHFLGLFHMSVKSSQVEAIPVKTTIHATCGLDLWMNDEPRALTGQALRGCFREDGIEVLLIDYCNSALSAH